MSATTRPHNDPATNTARIPAGEMSDPSPITIGNQVKDETPPSNERESDCDDGEEEGEGGCQVRHRTIARCWYWQ